MPVVTGSTNWSCAITANLNALDCPSASQCLAVGAAGTLLGTADAGLLWTTQAATSTANLQGVSCVDTSTCVAVGTSGTVLTSSGRSQWAYDGNGNLLTSDTTGITTTYGYAAAITPNLVLTLTTPGQLNRYYGYDQNGDTTAITTSSGSLNTQLQYDSQARPITVTLADGTQIVQGYNAQGQRASYAVSKSGVTSYSAQLTYRGAELGQAVIVAGSQAYTDTYLYGPAGLPVELLRQQGGATSRYYYEEDGRGNVVALTNISGTVVDHYAYDVWGRLMAASEQVPQRLRYGGYWYDAEVGWYWVSVRFYDPVLERWLEPDPSQQDGVRTYVYVGDDPIDATDPTGLYQNPPACSAYTSHTYCEPSNTPSPSATPTTTTANNGTCSGQPNAVVVCKIGNGLYQIAVGDSIETVQNPKANAFLKLVAGADLASNAVLVIPIAGEAAEAGKFGLKAAFYGVRFTVVLAVAAGGALVGFVASSLAEPTIMLSKRDIDMINKVAKEKGMTPRQRREFGDFVEDVKQAEGRRNDDHFTYPELKQLADEFLNP